MKILVFVSFIGMVVTVSIVASYRAVSAADGAGMLSNNDSIDANNGSKIDKFKTVFNRFPQNVPTEKVVDAPITGNGDIGLTMSPCEGGVDFYVGKNDFWKAVESYPDGRIMLPGGLSVVSDVINEGGIMQNNCLVVQK